jgi:hypothetical protein
VNHYTPRRANLTRWLQDAPDYVLDVFDDPRTCDRYTVMFTGRLLEYYGEEHTFANTYVQLLDMSGSPSYPQGVSMWGELKAYEAAAYRYSNHHRRIRWNDLPEHIKAHVRARAEEDYE